MYKTPRAILERRLTIMHQPQSLIPFRVLPSLQAREDNEGTGHKSCSPDIQDFVRLKDHFCQVWGKLEQATIALYTGFSDLIYITIIV